MLLAASFKLRYQCCRFDQEARIASAIAIPQVTTESRMELTQIFRQIISNAAALYDIPRQITELRQAIGRIELRQLENRKSRNLHENEFKVFSQWGEDGIIQFLLRHITIQERIFIEFGVGDYTESNTRFLLKQDNWKGLLIDGSATNTSKIRSSQEHWQHDLTIECAFITKDNINQLISKNGVAGEIGILSVDIDGNDYWIWEAINCVNPAIVICEYNSLFGPAAAVSTPYDEAFYIFKAHFSGLYWGASVAAFHHLGKKKGYSLVGSNTAGNNLFFVRDDLLGSLPSLGPDQAYVQSRFRISRDRDGKLSYLTAEQCLKLIAGLPLIDVRLNISRRAAELIN